MQKISTCPDTMDNLEAILSQEPQTFYRVLLRRTQ